MNENHRTVTIQQCPRCKEEACEVCCLAHEQTDDAADGVLLNSYSAIFKTSHLISVARMKA